MQEYLVKIKGKKKPHFLLVKNLICDATEYVSATWNNPSEGGEFDIISADVYLYNEYFYTRKKKIQWESLSWKHYNRLCHELYKSYE